jgi:hypothetical protein
LIEFGPVRGNLWLRSDRSQRVGRLDLDIPLDPDVDELRDLDEIWNLPEGRGETRGRRGDRRWTVGGGARHIVDVGQRHDRHPVV